MGKILQKAQTGIATLDAYIRAHPWKTASAVYALGTFATAGVFATQLMHAPLDPKHNPPTLPKNTPQMMYLIPPAVTTIITLLEIYILSRGVLGKRTRLFQFALGVFMILGWLVTTALWGHCHVNAQDDPRYGWPKVCYQYNLRFEGHGYIEGVNHQLGDAVVAMGAIMIVFYAGFAWKIAKNRRPSPDDVERGSLQAGMIHLGSMHSGSVYSDTTQPAPLQPGPMQTSPSHSSPPPPPNDLPAERAFREEFWAGGHSRMGSPSSVGGMSVGGSEFAARHDAREF